MKYINNSNNEIKRATILSPFFILSIEVFSFYKQMLLSAKDNSVEPMSFKIETPNWEDEEDMKHYNLYDSVHRHSRLCIRVKESADKIYLDIMPF